MDSSAKKTDDNPVMRWVTFRLENEKYGINVMQVQEVLRVTEIAPVPGAPDYVLGIINLRGNVVTVIDTRKRFGLHSKDVDEATRIWNSGLENLQHYVYSEYSRLHVRYKIATWLRGLIPLPSMRPPMPKPKKAEITNLRDLLKGAGLSVIPDEDINKILNQLPS